MARTYFYLKHFPAFSFFCSTCFNIIMGDVHLVPLWLVSKLFRSHILAFIFNYFTKNIFGIVN